MPGAGCGGSAPSPESKPLGVEPGGSFGRGLAGVEMLGLAQPGPAETLWLSSLKGLG